MAREDPHFRLRIPQDLKAKVEEAAHESRRSITAEIVSRLQLSFDLDNVSLPLNLSPEVVHLLSALNRAVGSNPDAAGEISAALERVAKPDSAS